MSDNQVSVVNELHKLEGKFKRQNAYDLKFENECHFARQQILKNDYTFSVAQSNQGSLQSAILNIAAIGVSLNPALAHAYLVPRDKAICLDVSYRGLVKLATDSGAIKWAKAVLVYEGDTFKWRGPNKAPKHEADPFDTDRIDAKDPLKNLKGGYCIAKLSDGDVLVEVMTAGEILEVRDSSMAFSLGKRDKGPWDGKWSGEMAKKALIKRASKSWPQSGGRERLDHAIDVINQHEGIQEAEAVDPQAIADFTRLLATASASEFYLFEKSLSDVQRTACFNSAPQGEKTAFKREVRNKITKAIEQRDVYIDELSHMLPNEDPAALQLMEELGHFEKRMVLEKLTELDKERLAQIERNAA